MGSYTMTALTQCDRQLLDMKSCICNPPVNSDGRLDAPDRSADDGWVELMQQCRFSPMSASIPLESLTPIA